MTERAARDNEGYLLNPEDWSEDLARDLAKEEGLELNGDAWSVLKFMRTYYIDRNVAPDVRHATDHLAAEKGCEKKEAKRMIFEMFPYGYVQQACKIAGMRKPRAWSTG